MKKVFFIWKMFSKKIMFISIFVSGLICLAIAGLVIENNHPHIHAGTGSKGYIALVIDDFGNHNDGFEEMISLGIPITAAVMPFLPFSQRDAEEAHQAGLEVILHLPMQPIFGKASWLGSGGITTDLSDEEIQSRVSEGLKQVKWAVGINNHMGSKAIRDRRVVKNILSLAKERNLYFLDSRTIDGSIASDSARELDIKYYKRDVFLDNSKKKEDIEKQLEKLSNIALKKGYAIGIGHVGAEGGKVTVDAIKSMYPILLDKGIEFVFVSQIPKNDLP